jgi:hypothetical protein
MTRAALLALAALALVGCGDDVADDRFEATVWRSVDDPCELTITGRWNGSGPALRARVIGCEAAP